MTKAERIVAAVYAALTTPAMTSVPVARVFRDLHGALQSEALPAVAVDTGDEDPPIRVAIGQLDRTLEVRVVVLAENSFSAADAALAEAYARIAADPTFGGLAFEVTEGTTRRDRADGARQQVAVIKTYRVQYRTTETSLET